MSDGHYYASRKNGVERIYYVRRLWELTQGFPVQRVPIETLRLNKSVWFHGRCPVMQEVIHEFCKVIEADLRYPIILDQSGSIMDGYHRVVKAIMCADADISCVKFPVNPEPDLVQWSRHHRPLGGTIADVVDALTLNLHREHDRVRVHLCEVCPVDELISWSDALLKRIEATTTALTALAKNFRRSEQDECLVANRLMVELVNIEIEWFADASVVWLDSVPNAPAHRLVADVTEAFDNIRSHLSHFALRGNP